MSELLMAHADETVPDGCKLVERAGNRLQVDLDLDKCPNAEAVLGERLQKLTEHFPILMAEKYKSRNGNFHVDVLLEKPVGDREAVILQQFLGSDPVRELLALVRLINGVYPAIVLYEPINSQRELIW